MHYLYFIKHKDSNALYVGVTSNLKLRWNSHKCSYNLGTKSKLYNHMRKYGFDNYEMVEEYRHESRRIIEGLEKTLIYWYRRSPVIKLLNLADGGEGGFVVPDHKIDEWKTKLKLARAGRKPALGMKHSDENKKRFSEMSNKYHQERMRNNASH